MLYTMQHFTAFKYFIRIIEWYKKPSLYINEKYVIKQSVNYYFSFIMCAHTHAHTYVCIVLEENLQEC